MSNQKALYPNIIPRGNSIQVTFSLPGHGRRRETVKISPTAKNQLLWVSKLEAIRDDIFRDTFVYENYFPDSKWVKRSKKTTRGQTVRAAMDVWLKRIKPEKKTSTNDSYRSSANILTAHFGEEKLLSELSVDDINQFVIAFRDQGKVTKTIRNKFCPLRGALQNQFSLPYETKMRLLEATGVGTTVAEKENPTRPSPYDLFEMTSLLDNLEGANLDLIKFYFGSGARSGEAFALCWEDIDEKDRTASIVTSLTAGTYSTPKHESARCLPLGDMAWEAIVAQRTRTFALPPVKIGNFGFKRPVFYNPRTNAPWLGSGQLRDMVWEDLIVASGVRHRSQYSTRHSFASMALMYGKNPLWVAGHLGHVDGAMVTRVYGRYLKDADKFKDHPLMHSMFKNAGAPVSLK